MRSLIASAVAYALTSATAGPARAQGPVPRGDSDCSVTQTAADVVASIAALAGAEGCGNDDCDRDGEVTSADVDCAVQCLFGACPIPDAAPRVTSVTPEFGSGIAPYSTVRVDGTGFGPTDAPKFVTIGGLHAAVIEVVDGDTLLVFVPALGPGPADLVVNAGAVDGFPFALTIEEPAPVGEPDTFDDVLDLIGVAVDRFTQLPIELLYEQDTAIVRRVLSDLLDELAMRRAELTADPGFTDEARAMVDAAFDSSGAAEQLRALIAGIEALLASGGDGGGAQGTAAVAIEALRKARTIKVVAAAAAATGGTITVSALVTIGLSIVAAAEIVAVAAAVANPARITKLTFLDRGGAERPHAVAGGTVRIQGERLTRLGIASRLAIDTARGPFRLSFEGTSIDAVARLPDGYAFCGAVTFSIEQTAFAVRSNQVPAQVQPEFLELSVDRARVGQPVSIQVTGTCGCDALVTYQELDRDFLSRREPIENITTNAARFTPSTLLDTPLTYRVRVEVADIASREVKLLDLAPELTGVTVACDPAEIALPPAFPSSSNCSCMPIPEDTTGFIGVKVSFASRDASLAINQILDFSADAVAKVPGENGAVTCTAKFVTNRPLVSEPVGIKVVDSTGPAVTLSAPPAEVDPGASVDLTVMAMDNDFVTRIVLRATGEAVADGQQEQLCTLLESNCTKTFTVGIKDGGFSDRMVTVGAQAFDGAGNMGMSAQRTFMVSRAVPDMQAPVVTIQGPQNGGRVRAGDMVQVSVRMTDDRDNDSGVEKVRIDVTGAAVASGLVPAELTLPKPLEVATRTGPFSVRSAAELASIADRTITITATATDAAGNMASAMTTVTAGAPPVIRSVFPSPVIAGDILRIVGDGFGESQGTSTVSIGGRASELSSWSNNEVLVLLPDDATGMVTVVVTVDGVASNGFPVTILGSGDVRITLVWDDTNDLDLFVIDPTGVRISYLNRSSPSGGVLDVDANAGCSGTTSSPRENIFWPTDGAPTGTYQVGVSYFRGCTTPPVASPFKVNVVVDGRFFTLMEGTIGSGSQSASFTR